jgi:hypothetical protein
MFATTEASGECNASVASFARCEPGRKVGGGRTVTGREILEMVVELLGQVSEGDEARSCARS